MALSQIYHQQRQSDDLELEDPPEAATSLQSQPLSYQGQEQTLEQGRQAAGGLHPSTYEWNVGQE